MQRVMFPGDYPYYDLMFLGVYFRGFDLDAKRGLAQRIRILIDKIQEAAANGRCQLTQQDDFLGHDVDKYLAQSQLITTVKHDTKKGLMLRWKKGANINRVVQYLQVLVLQHQQKEDYRKVLAASLSGSEESLEKKLERMVENLAKTILFVEEEKQIDLKKPRQSICSLRDRRTIREIEDFMREKYALWVSKDLLSLQKCEMQFHVNGETKEKIISTPGDIDRLADILQTLVQQENPTGQTDFLFIFNVTESQGLTFEFHVRPLSEINQLIGGNGHASAAMTAEASLLQDRTKYAKRLKSLILEASREDSSYRFIEKLGKLISTWMQEEFQIDIKMPVSPDKDIINVGNYGIQRIPLSGGQGKYELMIFGVYFRGFDSADKKGAVTRQIKEDYRDWIVPVLSGDEKSAAVSLERMVENLAHTISFVQMREGADLARLSKEPVAVTDRTTIGQIEARMREQYQLYVSKDGVSSRKAQMIFYGPEKIIAERSISEIASIKGLADFLMALGRGVNPSAPTDVLFTCEVVEYAGLIFKFYLKPVPIGYVHLSGQQKEYAQDSLFPSLVRAFDSQTPNPLAVIDAINGARAVMLPENLREIERGLARATTGFDVIQIAEALGLEVEEIFKKLGCRVVGVDAADLKGEFKVTLTPDNSQQPTKYTLRILSRDSKAMYREHPYDVTLEITDPRHAEDLYRYYGSFEGIWKWFNQCRSGLSEQWVLQDRLMALRLRDSRGWNKGDLGDVVDERGIAFRVLLGEWKQKHPEMTFRQLGDLFEKAVKDENVYSIYNQDPWAFNILSCFILQDSLFSNSPSTYERSSLEIHQLIDYVKNFNEAMTSQPLLKNFVEGLMRVVMSEPGSVGSRQEDQYWMGISSQQRGALISSLAENLRSQNEILGSQIYRMAAQPPENIYSVTSVGFYRKRKGELGVRLEYRKEAQAFSANSVMAISLENSPHLLEIVKQAIERASLTGHHHQNAGSPAMRSVKPWVEGGIDLSQQDSAMHVEKDARGGVKVTVDKALIALIEHEGFMREVHPVVIYMGPADPKNIFGVGGQV
ncbi:MAG: hypothetical protein HQL13_06760 [Candidatus Omnitrophica bacterium]|nr:hypothetical protein [Candidatus Omnitrophota bacterium]